MIFPPFPSFRFIPILLVGVLWVSATGLGLGWWWTYAGTPGRVQTASESWPSATKLARVAGQPSLLVFLHPRCPCSRATLEELASLVTEGVTGLRTQVVFYHPEGTDPSWSHTRLWEDAAIIPGVTVISDEGGAEAGRFHSTVSGEAYWYDGNGICRFHGGLTPARGHAGESAGQLSLQALLHQQTPSSATAPVFGCSLRGSTTTALPATIKSGPVAPSS